MVAKTPVVQAAFEWVQNPVGVELPDEWYCRTADVLKARLNRFRMQLVKTSFSEDQSQLFHAILSEIGGNSFDHNLGQWKDIPGVLFASSLDNDKAEVVLADRGQGIRATLQKVLPSIQSDDEALRIAFLEHISGRAPERRGDGLKFVRENILEDSINLFFQSGNATYLIEKNIETFSHSDDPVGGCIAILGTPC